MTESEADIPSFLGLLRTALQSAVPSHLEPLTKTDLGILGNAHEYLTSRCAVSPFFPRYMACTRTELPTVRIFYPAKEKGFLFQELVDSLCPSHPAFPSIPFFSLFSSPLSPLPLGSSFSLQLYSLPPVSYLHLISINYQVSTTAHQALSTASSFFILFLLGLICTRPVKNFTHQKALYRGIVSSFSVPTCFNLFPIDARGPSCLEPPDLLSQPGCSLRPSCSLPLS